LKRAAEDVAKRLGNTASICRKCYIHPEIFEAYLDGDLVDGLKVMIDEKLKDPPPGMSAEEAAVMAFLHRRLARDAVDVGGRPAGVTLLRQVR
jgi:DNA topoisomerase-1